MPPYLNAMTPMPDCDPWERAFWTYCGKKDLRFQQCASCGQVRHPPMPVCAQCRSTEEQWIPAPVDAELYTFTIVRHANHDALVSALPFNAAVVLFPSLQSVRLVSNVIDCPAENLRIGMPLRLVWEEQRPGRFLPRFSANVAGARA